MTEPYYVYLARCANGSLYTGCTNNVERRMAEHNAGRGGRYTQSNRPLELLGFCIFDSRTEALRIEKVIKRLPPEQKITLLETKLLSQKEIMCRFL